MDRPLDDADRAETIEEPTGEDAPTRAGSKSGRFGMNDDRLDTILTWAVVIVLALALSFATFFVLTVYQDREQERLATPALRTIDALKQVVRDDPNNPDARVRLGEGLAAAGLYDEALESFGVALEIDPEHAGAYLDIGRVSMATEDRGTAEAAFLKVLDITGQSQYATVSDTRELAFYHLGIIAVDEERFEDAVGFLREALRIRRDASDTYYQMALALRGLGEEEAAIEQLIVATTFDSNYPEARLLLGQIHLERSEEASAAGNLRWAADITNEAEIVMELLATLGEVDERITTARAALESGDLELAWEQAYIAWAIDSESVDALVLRADVFEARGDQTAALENLEAALVIVPDDQAIADRVEALKEALGVEVED